MFKRKLTQGDFYLIVANAVPVYGVWFLGWSAVEAFTVYALETLIIGMLTLLKMAVVTIVRRNDLWHNNGTTTRVSGLFFMVYFTLHYGLFACVQSTIFSQVTYITPPGSGPMHFFFHWYEYINKDIGIMLGTFVVGYLARSFYPFIVNGEFRTISMTRLMFQPYGRIFIQQFTVIVGSMFLSFGFDKGFILVFALTKMWMDVHINFDKVLDKTMMDLDKESAK